MTADIRRIIGAVALVTAASSIAAALAVWGWRAFQKWRADDSGGQA